MPHAKRWCGFGGLVGAAGMLDGRCRHASAFPSGAAHHRLGDFGELIRNLSPAAGEAHRLRQTARPRTRMFDNSLAQHYRAS